MILAVGVWVRPAGRPADDVVMVEAQRPTGRAGRQPVSPVPRTGWTVATQLDGPPAAGAGSTPPGGAVDAVSTKV
jgi:hypothetical protein